jgi:branched-chain amino acid transport system ATP-binding protein
MAVMMELADRLTFLNRGAVLAQGDPETVAREPAVVNLYLGEMEDA